MGPISWRVLLLVVLFEVPLGAVPDACVHFFVPTEAVEALPRVVPWLANSNDSRCLLRAILNARKEIHREFPVASHAAQQLRMLCINHTLFGTPTSVQILPLGRASYSQNLYVRHICHCLKLFCLSTLETAEG